MLVTVGCEEIAGAVLPGGGTKLPPAQTVTSPLAAPGHLPATPVTEIL